MSSFKPRKIMSPPLIYRRRQLKLIFLPKEAPTVHDPLWPFLPDRRLTLLPCRRQACSGCAQLPFCHWPTLLCTGCTRFFGPFCLAADWPYCPVADKPAQAMHDLPFALSRRAPLALVLCNVEWPLVNALAQWQQRQRRRFL